MKNAPITFQGTMDIVLSTVKWQSALVYLDEGVIFLRYVGEHLDHLQSVLRLLEGASATLKLKNCFFFYDIIDYLGHVTQEGRLGIWTEATVPNPWTTTPYQHD